MNIRKANQHDSHSIAPLLLLAMEDIIFKFIGQSSKDEALKFLNKMVFQKNNQYSYENCWIIEEDNKILAAANIYNGANLDILRAPIIKILQEDYQQPYHFEDETTTGEIYIDSIAVNPQQQGRGLGSKLLHFIINVYVFQNHQTLGLLVDKENPHAKKLYIKLGFKKIGEKTLVGKTMEHLQISKN